MSTNIITEHIIIIDITEEGEVAGGIFYIINITTITIISITIIIITNIIATIITTILSPPGTLHWQGQR